MRYCSVVYTFKLIHQADFMQICRISSVNSWSSKHEKYTFDLKQQLTENAGIVYIDVQALDIL